MQDCRCRGANGGEQQRVQADGIRQCSGFGRLSFWYLSPPASLCAELAGKCGALAHHERWGCGGFVTQSELVAATLFPARPTELGEMLKLRSLRLADNSVDLLRNAIARRDNLLAEQRAAYFRDLLQYKADKQAAALNAPAATYEKALEGVPVEERPAFFDACVFEAVHLACDTPMADKAKRALEQASAKQMEAQGSAAVEVGRMKQLLESERRKQREVNAQYEARGQQVEADVAKAVLAGIADATEEMTRRHQEDIDRAWERIRELEQEVRATWSR